MGNKNSRLKGSAPKLNYRPSGRVDLSRDLPGEYQVPGDSNVLTIKRKRWHGWHCEMKPAEGSGLKTAKSKLHRSKKYKFEASLWNFTFEYKVVWDDSGENIIGVEQRQCKGGTPLLLHAKQVKFSEGTGDHGGGADASVNGRKSKNKSKQQKKNGAADPVKLVKKKLNAAGYLTTDDIYAPWVGYYIGSHGGVSEGWFGQFFPDGRWLASTFLDNDQDWITAKNADNIVLQLEVFRENSITSGTWPFKCTGLNARHEVEKFDYLAIFWRRASKDEWDEGRRKRQRSQNLTVEDAAMPNVPGLTPLEKKEARLGHTLRRYYYPGRKLTRATIGGEEYFCLPLPKHSPWGAIIRIDDSSGIFQWPRYEIEFNKYQQPYIRAKVRDAPGRSGQKVHYQVTVSYSMDPTRRLKEKRQRYSKIPKTEGAYLGGLWFGDDNANLFRETTTLAGSLWASTWKCIWGPAGIMFPGEDKKLVNWAKKKFRGGDDWEVIRKINQFLVNEVGLAHMSPSWDQKLVDNSPSGRYLKKYGKKLKKGDPHPFEGTPLQDSIVDTANTPGVHENPSYSPDEKTIILSWTDWFEEYRWRGGVCAHAYLAYQILAGIMGIPTRGNVCPGHVNVETYVDTKQYKGWLHHEPAAHPSMATVFLPKVAKRFLPPNAIDVFEMKNELTAMMDGYGERGGGELYWKEGVPGAGGYSETKYTTQWDQSKKAWVTTPESSGDQLVMSTVAFAPEVPDAKTFDTFTS